MNYFKLILILLFLISINVKAEQTVLEPKIIEYKGIKEEKIKQVEERVSNLSQKQKSLEEKLSQLEKTKVTSIDNEVLEKLLADMEDIKNNQKVINKNIQEIQKYNTKIFFIQILLIMIFIFLILLLYKNKKANKSYTLKEENRSDVIKALTEKAKDDQRVAEILKIYLNNTK